MFNRLGKKLSSLGKRLGLKNNGFQHKLGLKKNIKKKPLSAQTGMTNEEKTSAKIAGDAYEEGNKRKGDIDGFKYQPQHSDNDRAVYHNSTTGHTRIGYKGTNSIKDLKVDLSDKNSILKGNQRGNEMYKKDLEHFDKVKKSLGSKKTTLSGHSLGGSRTFNVSKNKNVVGHAFNTGRSPLDKQMSIDRKKCNSPNPPSHCDKMVSLRTGNDPLSYANKGAYGKHKQFKSHSFNAHSMDNFSK
tara:strand:+ start:872 stop:1600 length:729 start_codon:yes stop_codon:yes gene_type:complete